MKNRGYQALFAINLERQQYKKSALHLTTILLLVALLPFGIWSCSTSRQALGSASASKGLYLGQTPPADSATLFAPGIVSTGMNERDIAIAPDGKELFFCREAGGFTYTTILHSVLVNGKWSEPDVLEFCRNPSYRYIEPQVSPDGRRLYFVSNQPIGSSQKGDENIWFSEKREGRWGPPQSLAAPVNSQSTEFFPSVTRQGTIYFTRMDTTAKEEYIYRCRYVNGEYQQPEKLGANVNMGKARYNAFISPDESYLIVPAFGMPDSFGGTDYYLVFRDEKDRWSKPMNMGPTVNSRNPKEWSASVSPDGRFLFFMSARMDGRKLDVLTARSLEHLHHSPQNGNTDIYWIGTAVVEALRSKAIFE